MMPQNYALVTGDMTFIVYLKTPWTKMLNLSLDKHLQKITTTVLKHSTTSVDFLCDCETDLNFKMITECFKTAPNFSKKKTAVRKR